MSIRNFAIVLVIFVMTGMTGCKTTGTKTPVSDLSQAQFGKIYYEVPKGIDLTDIISGKNAVAEKEVVYGKLFLPLSAEGKAAAVVILHGSGGVSDWREIKMAKALNAKGIAAFIPYSFAARGVYRAGLTKGTGISFGMRMADAYAALNLLSTHPQIDNNKIGIVGYSSGGIVSHLSADEKVRKAMAKSDLKFVAHVSVYTCAFFVFKNPTPTNAPILFLVGEKDDLCPKANILGYAERLKKAGASVESIEYPGAYHLFEAPFALKRIDRGNDGSCEFEIQDAGGLKDYATGEIFSEREWVDHTEPCSSRGYTLGRNDSAAVKYIQDTVDFFINSLHPGI